MLRPPSCNFIQYRMTCAKFRQWHSEWITGNPEIEEPDRTIYKLRAFRIHLLRQTIRLIQFALQLE
jgi:hypothetical protein